MLRLRTSRSGTPSRRNRTSDIGALVARTQHDRGDGGGGGPGPDAEHSREAVQERHEQPVHEHRPREQQRVQAEPGPRRSVFHRVHQVRQPVVVQDVVVEVRVEGQEVALGELGDHRPAPDIVGGEVRAVGLVPADQRADVGERSAHDERDEEQRKAECQPFARRDGRQASSGSPARRAGRARSAVIAGAATRSQAPRPPAAQRAIRTTLLSAWPRQRTKRDRSQPAGVAPAGRAHNQHARQHEDELRDQPEGDPKGRWRWRAGFLRRQARLLPRRCGPYWSSS